MNQTRILVSDLRDDYYNISGYVDGREVFIVNNHIGNDRTIFRVALSCAVPSALDEAIAYMAVYTEVLDKVKQTMSKIKMSKFDKLLVERILEEMDNYLQDEEQNSVLLSVGGLEDYALCLLEDDFSQMWNYSKYMFSIPTELPNSLIQAACEDAMGNVNWLNIYEAVKDAKRVK